MKYKIVYADSFPDLEKMVNELVEQGWEPVGGVYVRSYEMIRKDTCYQALILKS